MNKKEKINNKIKSTAKPSDSLKDRLAKVLETQKGQSEILEEIKKWHKEEVMGKAWITTAVRLDKSEIDTLSQEISRIFGRSLAVENVVDKDVLGGIKIQVGDQIIDQTLEGKLQILKKKLIH